MELRNFLMSKLALLREKLSEKLREIFIEKLWVIIRKKALEIYKNVNKFIDETPELKRIRTIIKDFPYKDEYNKYYSAAAYIPFIGWLLPLYLKKEVNSCREHGKHGFLWSIFFAGCVLFIFFLNLIFIPRDWRIISLILAILTYIIYALYFLLCGFSLYYAYNEKRLELGWLNQYERYLDIFKL